MTPVPLVSFDNVLPAATVVLLGWGLRIRDGVLLATGYATTIIAAGSVVLLWWGRGRAGPLAVRLGPLRATGARRITPRRRYPPRWGPAADQWPAVQGLPSPAQRQPAETLTITRPCEHATGRGHRRQALPDHPAGTRGRSVRYDGAPCHAAYAQNLAAPLKSTVSSLFDQCRQSTVLPTYPEGECLCSACWRDSRRSSAGPCSS